MALTYASTAVGMAHHRDRYGDGDRHVDPHGQPGHHGRERDPNNSASGYTQSVRPSITWGSLMGPPR